MIMWAFNTFADGFRLSQDLLGRILAIDGELFLAGCF